VTTRFLRSPLAQIVAIVATLALITTCNDQLTRPDPDASPPSRRPELAVTAEPATLVAAGNIARCDRTNDEATALVLDGIPGTVVALGDNVYAGGALSDFDACYEPSWGRHKARTRPTAGDEDYKTAGAAGYFSYFGAAAGDPATGYFSYDLGEWHIVALNSNISTTASSAQVTWLKADLAATTKSCVLAYWHHPRFSSYGTAVRSAVKPLWDELYAARADVVLNAHYRLYERFALQTPQEAPDPALGIRQFTVGTGGQGLHTAGTPRPNSEVRSSGIYGVLKLTLDAGSYSWEFKSIAGQTFTDAGTTTCHGRPGGPPPPNQAPIASHGGPYSSEATVSFDGSASRDPDGNLPLSYAWDFGGGATATGVNPSRTYDSPGEYTVSLVVTDALGLASASVSTTVTIGNLPPAVNAGADITVDQGAPFEMTGTFTDAGGAGDAPWSWTIGWGDGASENGTSSTLGGPITRTHTFTTLGAHTVRLTVTDKDGGTAFDERVVTVVDPTAEAVLVGAGDIAGCYQDFDEATAKLLDAIPGTVITLGDNAYGVGSLENFNECYQPTWGRHKARTKPSPGNHDYGSGGAPGYFGYFGALAGDPTKGYYSYIAGDWLVLSLNTGSSSSERDADSPQVQWIRAQLATTTKDCVVAYMHHPQFTSTEDRHSFEWNTTDIWNALYEGGADLVLAAHDHLYERFAPMRPDGTLDSQYGIRQITNGAGGEYLYNFGTIHPNSVVRSNTSFGVLKLTLRRGSYDWEFIPIAGNTFRDSGTGTCHGKPGGSPPPNQPPTANHGGPYQADQTVAFSGSGSDPDGNLPLTYTWTFHDGSTSNVANPMKTYAADGSYSATLVVKDALDLASPPATTTVTIANVAPTVNAGLDATRQLGSAFDLSATFTDPGGAADSPWSYTVTWGDGSTTPTEGSATTSTSPITASHTYGAAGQYTVTVMVTDKDGGSATDALVVTVTAPTPNQAPTANAGGPYSADNTITFNGSGSDPDGDLPLTFSWTFHDGSTSSLASPTKTYATDGNYSASLIVTDAKGLQSPQATASVTIANQAPVVNAGADRTVEADVTLGVSITFSDPGGSADGPWSWFITWGDGTRTPDDGSTSTLTSPITSTHTYSSFGQYTMQVTVTDKDGGTSSDAALVTVTAPGTSVVVVGAGNIARCDGTNDEATATLLDNIAGTVFTTGDNIHASGTLADYETCYGSATTGWGRHKGRTRPSPGDDDYKTAGASGYFDYFGAAAGNRGEGYYSYDLGNWHIVVLNSNIPMTVGSPQESWLKADLAATTKQCVLAYWHHPRFSSYSTAVRPEVKPFWDALYAAGAEVVLNGHYRLYERFAPQTPDGARDDARGIRQFTVGTGGHGVHTFGTPRPNSEVRLSGVYGVLKLTLDASSYSWQFVPVGGQTPTESGTTSCH
jgi:PKD repeat protein